MPLLTTIATSSHWRTSRSTGAATTSHCHDQHLTHHHTTAISHCHQRLALSHPNQQHHRSHCHTSATVAPHVSRTSRSTIMPVSSIIAISRCRERNAVATVCTMRCVLTQPRGQPICLAITPIIYHSPDTLSIGVQAGLTLSVSRGCQGGFSPSVCRLSGVSQQVGDHNTATMRCCGGETHSRIRWHTARIYGFVQNIDSRFYIDHV